MSHSEDDLQKLETFVHRTFNGQDFSSFIRSLQNIYKNHDGLETVFAKHQEPASIQKSISEKKFFEIPHQYHLKKHVSDPMNGSAAKKTHMFLRWMSPRQQRS
jgi:hypothetical protein